MACVFLLSFNQQQQRPSPNFCLKSYRTYLLTLQAFLLLLLLLSYRFPTGQPASVLIALSHSQVFLTYHISEKNIA